MWDLSINEVHIFIFLYLMNSFLKYFVRIYKANALKKINENDHLMGVLGFQCKKFIGGWGLVLRMA